MLHALRNCHIHRLGCILHAGRSDDYFCISRLGNITDHGRRFLLSCVRVVGLRWQVDISNCLERHHALDFICAAQRDGVLDGFIVYVCAADHHVAGHAGRVAFYCNGARHIRVGDASGDVLHSVGQADGSMNGRFAFSARGDGILHRHHHFLVEIQIVELGG